MENQTPAREKSILAPGVSNPAREESKLEREPKMEKDNEDGRENTRADERTKVDFCKETADDKPEEVHIFLDTPPRLERSHSCDASYSGRIDADLTVIISSPEEALTNDGKRKRVEQEKQKKKIAEETQFLQDLIRYVTKDIASLAKLVKDNSNTKKEIKELSQKLSYQAGKLKSVRVEQFLHTAMEDRTARLSEENKSKMARKEGEKEHCEDQVKTLNSRIEAFERALLDKIKKDKEKIEEKKEMATQAGEESEKCDAATQTLPWKDEMKLQEEKSFLEELTKIQNYQDYEKVASKKWKEEVFKKVHVKVGNPIDAINDGCTMIMTEKEDLNMKASIQRMYSERFPEIREMEENIEQMETATTRYRNGEEIQTIRRIMKLNAGDLGEELWARLQAAKTMAIRNGEKKIVTHRISSMEPERTRKMLEAIFSQTEIEIDLYIPRQAQPNNKRVENQTSKEQGRKTKTQGIILQTTPQTYSETLKKLRDTLKDKEDQQGIIKQIRSTREGELLVVLKNDDEEDIKKIEKTITDGMKETKARRVGHNRGTYEAMQIRGMDMLTTEEEVQRAIEKEIGKEEMIRCRIGGLRPGFGNTKVVTVMAESKIAEKLKGKKSIRVGVVTCRMDTKKEEYRCFKCWEYGHRARECKSTTNRTMLCYKCGKEGHNIKNCKGEEYCPLCNEGGHMAGRSKCKTRHTNKERKTSVGPEEANIAI